MQDFRLLGTVRNGIGASCSEARGVVERFFPYSHFFRLNVDVGDRAIGIAVHNDDIQGLW
jgi:hypothetical protein